MLPVTFRNLPAMKAKARHATPHPNVEYVPGHIPYFAPHSHPPTIHPPPKCVAAIVNATRNSGSDLPAIKKSEAYLIRLLRMIPVAIKIEK